MLVFKRKPDFTIPEGGVDSIERLTINGVEQTILTQAVDPTNPVLLFVHGGPCMPVPGIVSHGQDYAVATTTKELVKHFVVVFWDQRGAGKSYKKSIPSESIRVEQYFDDCNALIDILRKRFHQDKIYLVGHSWGTVIGLSIVSRYPEKIHAYVGISQIVNWADNDRLCYEWVQNRATEANDQKTLKKLSELGIPPYIDSINQWTGLRRILLKYNSMIYETDTIKSPGMKGAFKLFLNSPHYSLIDIINTFYSSYKLTYTQDLIEDISKIDFNDLTRLDTPTFFLHGTHDFHVFGDAVEEFYNKLETPYRKELVWYDKSSHMFHPDDARKIEKYLIEVVKT